MPLTRRETKTFPINIRELRVSRVVDTGSFRRLTLTGDQLASFTTTDGIAVPPLRTEGFDDHVKVIVPGLGEETAAPPRQVEGHLDWSGSSPGKDYTPVRYDPIAREIDLEFVRHPGGLASDWAEGVTVGNPAWIAGPKSSALIPEGFDWLLVGGDETALPAIARLLDELPPVVRAQVFIEVPGPQDEREVTAGDGVVVTWLHRDGALAGSTTLLEDAVRAAPWWPGSVYCWFAGEAQTLRPIRSWLKSDRQVPRDCVEVTGYWRRPDVAETADEDSGWERLDTLLDVSTPAAVRTAIRAGLFARIEAEPVDATTLAEDLGLHEPTLRALLRLLVAHDLLAATTDDPALVGDGVLRLGPLGELLVEDDRHLTHEPDSFLDLDPSTMLHMVRTGEPTPRGDGRAAREVLAADDALGVGVREQRLDDATWAAPSIVAHHDWSGLDGALVVGDTYSAVRAALADTVPGLTTRGAPDLETADPGPGEVVVVSGALEVLDDDAAIAGLTALADRCRGSGTQVVLAERLTPSDAVVHDHDALLDLQLRAAFGSGLRTATELVALAEQAGFAVAEPAGIDIGWDVRLWHLAP